MFVILLNDNSMLCYNICFWVSFALTKVIEANRNGEINLKIETDLVSVSTHFKDLGNPPWGKWFNINQNGLI